jgi:hypothetical protein
MADMGFPSGLGSIRLTYRLVLSRETTKLPRCRQPGGLIALQILQQFRQVAGAMQDANDQRRTAVGIVNDDIEKAGQHEESVGRVSQFRPRHADIIIPAYILRSIRGGVSQSTRGVRVIFRDPPHSATAICDVNL